MRRGDVVLAWTPFASGVGGKRRPLVVVQNDADLGRLGNTIVAVVTSNLARAAEATQVHVAAKTPEGRQTGLLHDSLISCDNLATIDRSRIDQVIGSLSPSAMRRVDDALKAALSLP